MHKSVTNLEYIKSDIKEKIKVSGYKNYNPNIIAVSKTFKIDHINPLIEIGHLDFGENKVQEAVAKWSETKKANLNLKLQ